MVMGFVLIFSITTSAIVIEVTSNEKSAGRDDKSSAVFNLAEASLNFGIDQVNKFDGAAGTAVNNTCFPSTNCSVYEDNNSIWTAYTGLPGLSSAEQPKWYAKKNDAGVWTVHARATRGSTTRELAVKLQRASDPQSPDLQAWQGAYSYNQPGTCILLSNGVTIAEDIYTSGDLCLDQNAGLVDSTPTPDEKTTLYVGGYLWLKNGAYAGKSDNYLLSATILGHCYTGNSKVEQVCSTPALSQVYAGSYPTGAAAEPVPKPPIDLTWYNRAAPRPDYPCLSGSYGTFPGTDNDSTRNNSLSNVELFASTSYKCSTPAGSIEWQSGNRKLIISGVVFVDGNFLESQNNVSVLYSGRGTIYFDGTIHITGNSVHLCPTSDCSAWNPDTNMLLLVALNNTLDGLPAQPPIPYTFTIENNAIFQGAGYAIGGFQTSNNGRIEGPIIADGLIYKNNAGYFTPLGGKGLPGGGPTTPNAYLPAAGSWRQVR